MLCDICGKAFAIADDFYKHYVTHENSSLLKCSLCAVKWSDGEDLPKHVCYETAIRDSKKYKTLVERYNFENSLSRLKKTNVKKCSKNVKGNLSKGLKNIKSEKEIDKCATEAYRCDICRRCFEEKEIFETHRSRHGVKGHFTCDTCGKEFREKLFYEVHTMSHKEQKPLKCEKCPEIFSDIVAFKRHRGGHKYKEGKIQKKVHIIKSQLNEKLVS